MIKNIFSSVPAAIAGAISIGIALGIAIGIADNFNIVLQGLWYISIALFGTGLLAGLIWLVSWRDKKRDEQHEKWFMSGAETGVRVVVETVKGEADRQVASGKVTVETLRLLKSTGALDNSNKPPLFLPGALTAGDEGNLIEGDYNVIHGLNNDETEAWQ